MDAIKKSLGLHRPSIGTSDSEFDELLVKFVAASKAGENMQRAWLTQLKWLEEQQSSINLAIDAVDTACGANTTTPAVALTLALRKRVAAYVDAVKACPTQRVHALRFVNAYIAMCERVRLCITQRSDLLKDLDYHRGKREDHMRKKKPDADKLAAYERGIQARKDAFAKANDIAKEGIRLVLMYKDAVMHDCLAALIDARAAHYTVSPDPYADIAKSVRTNAPHLFTGEPWPEPDIWLFQQAYAQNAQ